ncbi:MAG: hypothetical protein HOP19_13445 [Acidobacteria bacterium]|nr:hypothetical protein [Acidobacteriota bacterium]
MVLPEDRANLRLADGFWQETNRDRQLQVLPESGGWRKVLGAFESEHVKSMRRSPHRLLILLIDFDEDGNRLAEARQVIPEDLQERVFVLGVWSEPEGLRHAGLGSLEDIGQALAKDCRDETDTVWNHQLLQHNLSEVARLRHHVREVLF